MEAAVDPLTMAATVDSLSDDSGDTTPAPAEAIGHWGRLELRERLGESIQSVGAALERGEDVATTRLRYGKRMG